MGSKTAFHVAYKSIDDHTLIATSAVEIGVCVGYNAAPITSPTTPILGIVKSPGVPGQTFDVAVMGTTPARVGAAVNLGDPLTSDTQGRLIPAIAGQPIFARAKEPAASADLYIEVFITREGKA